MLVPSSDVTRPRDPGMSVICHTGPSYISAAYITHVEVRRCCPRVNAPWVLQARSIISYSEHLYHGKDSTLIRTGMCRSSYSGSLHGSQQILTSIQAVDTPGLHQVAAGQTHMNLSLIMGVKRPRNPVFFVRSVSHRHMCFPATRCLLMM